MRIIFTSWRPHLLYTRYMKMLLSVPDLSKNEKINKP